MLKRELKVNRKSMYIWCGILMFFFGIVFLVYPSLMTSDIGVQMDEMLAMFPPEMLEMFNMDLVGIETVFAWMQTEGYLFMTLLGGIFSAMLGAGILLKEENDKTIEFLFAKPVSRSQIVTSKVLAGVIHILILTAAITLFNMAGLYFSGELEMKSFLLMSLTPLLLYLMLFSICLFISSFLRKTKQANNLALGITVLSFLMQMIGSMGESTKMIGRLSLFEFVSARYLIENGRINPIYLAIGAGLILACLLGTYIQYNRKELTV